MIDYKGATLIADYGHNPDAMRPWCRPSTTMPAKRRSVVISGAGDRRDEDIREQTGILGAGLRRRDPVPGRLPARPRRRRGDGPAARRPGRRTAHHARREIRGEFMAIDTALARLQPGDLCLMLIDQVEEALAHLAQRCADAGACGHEAPRAGRAGAVRRPWVAGGRASSAGEKIGTVDTAFQWIGRDHDIIVEAYDDPGVQGVTCYVSRARVGGIKGTLGLAEDRAEASIACRQVGPIGFPEPLKKQEEVFSERMSILFKRLRIVRMVDAPRNTLVYLTYSEKLIDGSPQNSVSRRAGGRPSPSRCASKPPLHHQRPAAAIESGGVFFTIKMTFTA